MSNPTFIDLFSGAGGLLRGFMNQGYRALFSVEVWNPAILTHKLNYPDISLWEEDIRYIVDSRLNPFVNKVDVIIGGLPVKDSQQLGKD